MTDNTQELDEILNEVTSFDVYKHPEYIEEAKQAILDWHNKQIEELLDRLESELEDLPYVTYKGGYQIPYEEIEALIQAERTKLKEVK